MALAPKALVQGAARQPLPFGLFSTFAFRPGSDRWQNGVEFETLTCDPVKGVGELECAPGQTESHAEGLPKDFQTYTTTGSTSSAFLIYGFWKCSPVGYTPETAQAKAAEHLQAREEARVEQAFWTGDLGNTPALATESVDKLTKGSSVEALGQLENYIAQTYGSLGVIHMSRQLATVLVSRQLLQTSGGRLTTLLGTPVAAGSGYPGTGPQGAAGNWAFVTPALFGYRSDILEPTTTPGDLLDRGTNDLFAIAERQYLLGFDPCGVGAVEIDITK